MAAHAGGELVRLLGANIAPTADLACRFDAVGASSAGPMVQASFWSAGEMRCLAPARSALSSDDLLVYGTLNTTSADDGGFVKIHCKKGTDEILGATICSERATVRKTSRRRHAIDATSTHWLFHTGTRASPSRSLRWRFNRI